MTTKQFFIFPPLMPAKAGISHISQTDPGSLLSAFWTVPSHSPVPTTPRVPYTGGWDGGVGWFKPYKKTRTGMSGSEMRRCLANLDEDAGRIVH